MTQRGEELQQKKMNVTEFKPYKQLRALNNKIRDKENILLLFFRRLKMIYFLNKYNTYSIELST